MKPLKCVKCKQAIEVDMNNIINISRFENQYYHTQCLCEKAQSAVIKKNHRPCWDNVLEHIDDCENEARDFIKRKYWNDNLNDYLLCNYGISIIPDRFWEMVRELNKGIYKGKRCKPISSELLFHAWEWGQKNLDKIDRNNKVKHKGPQNGSDRISYDFAIVLRHIEDYEKYVAKTKAEEAERELQAKETVKIDYNNIKAKKDNNFGDISDLIDDLI